MPTNGMQTSNAQDLKAGISALNMAENGINRIVTDVQASKADLQSRWDGDDGRSFQQLVDRWLIHAEKIQNALRALESQMTMALSEKGSTQQSNVDAIQQRGSASERVADALLR